MHPCFHRPTRAVVAVGCLWYGEEVDGKMMKSLGRGEVVGLATGAVAGHCSQQMPSLKNYIGSTELVAVAGICSKREV